MQRTASVVSKYAVAGLLGLAAGALIGWLVGAIVGLTAMSLIQFQDTPPDYAFLPLLIGVVAGPIWGVLRVRARARHHTGGAPPATRP